MIDEQIEKLRKRLSNFIQVESIFFKNEEFIVYYSGPMPERNIPITWSKTKSYLPLCSIRYKKIIGDFVEPKRIQ